MVTHNFTISANHRFIPALKQVLEQLIPNCSVIIYDPTCRSSNSAVGKHIVINPSKPHTHVEFKEFEDQNRKIKVFAEIGRMKKFTELLNKHIGYDLIKCVEVGFKECQLSLLYEINESNVEVSDIIWNDLINKLNN